MEQVDKGAGIAPPDTNPDGTKKGFLQGNNKWYAIGAVAGLGVIMYLRGKSSTASGTAPNASDNASLQGISDLLSQLIGNTKTDPGAGGTNNPPPSPPPGPAGPGSGNTGGTNNNYRPAVAEVPIATAAPVPPLGIPPLNPTARTTQPVTNAPIIYHNLPLSPAPAIQYYHPSTSPILVNYKSVPIAIGRTQPTPTDYQTPSGALGRGRGALA